MPAESLGVLLLSGAHDRAHYAFVVAAGAAALGRSVVLFATNAGCHALIRDGATLARNAADVLEAIGRSAPEVRPAPRTVTDPVAAALLTAIDAGARELDDLVAASGIPAGVALAALTMLELEGTIERGAPASYSRT